ncbi:hypothetical protein OPQ81_002747 [Rhizoctonia solani]|nr:hypothetical protein OPQ81_002747 [Rhizoctonia solani]
MRVLVIELENIAFSLRTDSSHQNEPTAGARTKRQLLAENASKVVDIGQPIKTAKYGPVEAFTPKELSVGTSSQGSSTWEDSSEESSSLGSISEARALEVGSSQSSIGVLIWVPAPLPSGKNGHENKFD